METSAAASAASMAFFTASGRQVEIDDHPFAPSLGFRNAQARHLQLPFRIRPAHQSAVFTLPRSSPTIILFFCAMINFQLSALSFSRSGIWPALQFEVAADSLVYLNHYRNSRRCDG